MQTQNIATSFNFLETFYGQLLVELLGGMIGSFIFLFIILLILRPKIDIASFICKVQKEGKAYYTFKFVNKSFFHAHDLKIELYVTKKIPMGRGKYNKTYQKLMLLNSEVNYLHKKPIFNGSSDEYKHCMLVSTSDNLENILNNDDSAVLIRICLKHGLTGLSNVFEQDFANNSDIKHSKFKPGPKFDVS
ncbi:MAG: hypothetical protein ACK5OS_05990 [Chryseotalea sp.]|jgi:hypothetical protein